jgi:serine O-acetyltransferase
MSGSRRAPEPNGGSEPPRAQAAESAARGAAPPRRDGSWARLRRDFRRLRTVKGRGFWMALVDAVLLDSGFQALAAHRCASALRRAGVPLLPAVFRRWAIGACGVDILPAADVGGGCIVAHGIGLVVGGATVIGEDCTLLHGVTLGEVRFDELACPRLGDRVTVGAGAIVLGGVEVGDDATIGAGAVVREDVPAGAAVAGVPARVIGRADRGLHTATPGPDTPQIDAPPGEPGPRRDPR